MEFQLHATVVSFIIICTWQCEALVVMTFSVYPEGISLELPTSNKQLADTTAGSTSVWYGQLKAVISNMNISASPVYYTWAAVWLQYW